MKVEVKELSPVEKSMTIEVEPERYGKVLDRVINNAGKLIQVPGFRKGKAPRKTLLSRFGLDSFKKDMLDELIPEVSREAFEEKDLLPLSTPVCTNYMEIELEEGRPLNFELKFEVKPDFELKDYKGLQLIRIIRDVNVDEMTDKQIKSLQEQQGTMSPIEDDRPLEKGDVANVDFESFKQDGTPIQQGSAKNYYMTMEADNFVPGFIDKVLGRKAGEEWEFDIVFPEDYLNKDMAGENVHFKVKLHQIMAKELPALDEEFAKSQGEFETFEDFRQSIKDKINDSIEQQQRNELQEQILLKLSEQIRDIPLPEALIEFHLNRFIGNLKNQLEMMGKTLDEHLSSLNTNLIEFKKKFKPQAVNAARSELILDKMAEIEKIEVNEEEVDEEVGKFAKNLKQDIELIKKAMLRDGYLGAIRYDLRNRKIFDILIDNADIAEKKPEEVLADTSLQSAKEALEELENQENAKEEPVEEKANEGENQ